MNIKELLTKEQMTLIVSLPENSLEMAMAAIEGGADAIKVHANVMHRASGNSFASVKEQADLFAEIIKVAGDIPVGLVPGEKTSSITGEELALAEELGFDFISVYAGHAPVKEIQSVSLEKVIAFSNLDSTSLDCCYSELGVGAIEASIIDKANYGARLTYEDIVNYSKLKKKVKAPVIIPTQKAIMPSELELLKRTGIDAIMIGAIVTGKTTEGTKRVTREFKNTIIQGGY